MTQHSTQMKSLPAKWQRNIHGAIYHKNKQDSISQSVLYEPLISRDVKASW